MPYIPVPLTPWREIGGYQWREVGENYWGLFRALNSSKLTMRAHLVKANYGSATHATRLVMTAEPLSSDVDYYHMMWRLLPWWEQEESTTQEMLKSGAIMLRYLNGRIQIVYVNLWTDTMLERLPLMMRDFGIALGGFYKYDYAFQRELLTERLHERYKPVQLPELEAKAEKITGNPVEFINVDAWEYDVQFTGPKGKPPNIDILVDEYDRTIPGHIEYNLKSRRTLWSEVGGTFWGTISSETWEGVTVTDYERVV